jgi:Holliday junction resolvasome RuvABC ATP-dependent DNA helicase subunit
MNEVNAVAPTSLKHLVGMKTIVDQVQVAIDASFADGTKFPHSLLVSEPGLGKSELCNVIKHEMAVQMHTVLGLSISHISDLNSLLLGANDKDIIYINECDSLKPEFQVALYLCMDQGKIVLSGSRSPHGCCSASRESRSRQFILQHPTTIERSQQSFR